MATMQFNSQSGKYEAILGDGSKLVVDSDVYAEQSQAGVDPRELESSATWENCQDGETVFIEKPSSPPARMGRPSNGREVAVQALITPELKQWLRQQRRPDESLSTVIYRLLDSLRQDG